MNRGKFDVAVTLIYKGNYDPMNETLFPVAEEDIRRTGKRKGYVKTIYLDADERISRAFRKHMIFYGRKSPMRYKAVPCQRYRDAVKDLYNTFAFNKKPWVTVNTGYLDKFYDVYAEEADNCDDGTSDIIDFGEYSPFIRDNYIPLWNVERYVFDGAGSVSCLPDNYFEHELQKKRGCEKDGYMVGVRKEIEEIIIRADKVYIRTQMQTISGWEAYRFVKKISIDSFGYERRLLYNHSKNMVFEYEMIRFAEEALYDRIRDYDVDDAVICSNHQVVPPDVVSESEGNFYFADMNPFIQSSCHTLVERRVLLLDFRAGETKMQLAEMMVRFLVSQLQLEMGEFRWAGRILDEMAAGGA